MRHFASFLLCHFLENLGSFFIVFVFTDVCKIQYVLLSAIEGLFVDFGNGLPQFGDSVGGGVESGACCDGDRKLLDLLNDISNRKAPSEPRF